MRNDKYFFKFIGVLLFLFASLQATIDLGVDTFFKEGYAEELAGKRIGLITNQTGVNGKMRSTIDLFLQHRLKLTAFFAPEHGLHGNAYAAEEVSHTKGPSGLPVYSLHGKTRRPTAAMLENIDVLIYDIQDIGCRSYTYATTLLYAMEEAAKRNIEVVVLDRPNPINGTTVDGPMLKEKWRSFIGYLNVPYCHGMTIGELALFFNSEYNIHCKLKVVPMRGWDRSMPFSETGLAWIPTSPHIPEADTPYYYATTGLLGELSIVNIGIGYTLPFKIVGAPWIEADTLANTLNAQKLQGVHFVPFHFRPFYGAYQGKDCHGVRIMITNTHTFRPTTCQCMILGILKNLYPTQVSKELKGLSSSKKDLFCKATGNDEMLTLLQQETYAAWKLILFQKEEREQFLVSRKKYLIY
ncbi:MAG: uncharacterized protein RLZZ453_768 [Chlamydiota bacterium]|jgi:uncharacterized protein YbbC (DUF1343 family)